MPELIPLAEAVAKISAKTPIGSVLRSAEWARMPLALRERSQFSAGVESVRVLGAIQSRLQDQLSTLREQLANGKTATFDRSSFIDAIRDVARAEGLTPSDPKDQGTIRDITSIPRLGLIYDMQTAQAQEYARWKADQTEGALLLYPAQEFTRIEDRRVPREDWPQRWAAACVQSGDQAALGVLQRTGRMIALKTSQVWEALSRFNTPWPPFDWGSGMGIEDIDYDTAVQLELIQPGQDIEPIEQGFNDRLESSVKGLSTELRDALKTHFGPQIVIDDDTVRWQPAQGQAYETLRDSQRDAARSGFSGSSEALESVGRGVPATEEARRLIEGARGQATTQATAVAAGRKPLYHEQLTPESAQLLADALRSSLPSNVSVRVDGPDVYVWRPDILLRSFTDIKAEIAAGRGGDLLGYGPTPMGTPGNVTVHILDQSGQVVAGFQTPDATAEIFARARAQDFADATGRPHNYVILGRQ